MLKRITLDEFLPDRPLSVLTAKNVYPMIDGYRPARQFQALTPALAGILGGAAFRASDGSATFLAGTASDLYRYSGGAWSSLMTGLTASVWRFDQFSDLAVGVNGDRPIQVNLLTGAASDLTDAPNGDILATVRQQLFIAGVADAQNVVYISGYLDPTGWTEGVNQSLVVPFENGGPIMGLAGGETGIILQRGAVRRATYTGDTVVWQFDEISREIGCMAKGSVATAGSTVFFLSEQGFMACDRTQVVPIGREKIDRTFFATYSREDIANIRSAIDPRATTVYWAMPGNPGQIWAYDWSLGKWSVIELSLSLIFSGFTANISIDALDALYPGGIDSIPLSLDDPSFAGGNPLFLVAQIDGTVGTLTGDVMPVEFVLKPFELGDGSRARIRGARVVSDAIQGTVKVDVRARAGDPRHVVTSGAIRDNGRVPLRANGRHVGVEIDIPSHEWSYALGIDLEYEEAGSR